MSQKTYTLKGVGQLWVVENDATGTPVSVPILELKNIEITLTSTIVELTGGDTNFPLDEFVSAKEGMVKITNAKVLPALWQLFGAAINPDASVNVQWTENFATSGSTAITLTYSAIADSVYAYNKDTLESIAITGSGTSWTLGSAPDNVMIRYERAVTGTEYTFKSSDVNKEFLLVHTSRRNDTTMQQIKAYKCKMQGTANLFKGAENEFTIPEMEAKILDPERSDEGIIVVTTWLES